MIPILIGIGVAGTPSLVMGYWVLYARCAKLEAENQSYRSIVEAAMRWYDEPCRIQSTRGLEDAARALREATQ